MGLTKRQQACEHTNIVFSCTPRYTYPVVRCESGRPMVPAGTAPMEIKYAKYGYFECAECDVFWRSKEQDDGRVIVEDFDSPMSIAKEDA